MAYHSKRANREEEEESVFISMTDLMISVLFIIMILMAYFSLRPFSNNNVEMIEKSKYNKVLLELDSAKALLKQREAEIEELLKQIFLLKSRLSIAEGKIKRLEVDVETAIGQSLKYSQRLVIIEKTLTETEEEVREVKDLNEQIIILIKEREALEKENADLKNKLEGKIPSELFDDQKDRLDKLRTYLIVLLKQIEELEKELEKSQMRNALK